MRELNFKEILFFYDGPELFSAYDQIGGLYLCSLVEKKEHDDTFLCVQLSKQRYDDFINGGIDLLTIIKNIETDEIYIGNVTDGNFKNIKLSLRERKEIPDSWLPESGLFIKPQPLFDTLVVRESHERQHAVIYFTLDPPEAKNESKIFADRLSEGVRLIQRVIKYAYRNAISFLEDKTNIAEIGHSNNYKLEVIGTSPGSFTLQMQTVAHSDMFGYSYVAKAMEIIDEINDNVNNPKQAVKFIANHGGPFHHRLSRYASIYN